MKVDEAPPVEIYRPAKGKLSIVFPDAVDHEWAEIYARIIILPHLPKRARRPRWDNCRKCWFLPSHHITRLVNGLRCDGFTVDLTLESGDTARCTSACFEAELSSWMECRCMCAGEYHGTLSPPPGSKTVADSAGGPVWVRSKTSRQTLPPTVHRRRSQFA